MQRDMVSRAMPRMAAMSVRRMVSLRKLHELDVATFTGRNTVRLRRGWE